MQKAQTYRRRHVPTAISAFTSRQAPLLDPTCYTDLAILTLRRISWLYSSRHIGLSRPRPAAIKLLHLSTNDREDLETDLVTSRLAHRVSQYHVLPSVATQSRLEGSLWLRTSRKRAFWRLPNDARLACQSHHFDSRFVLSDDAPSCETDHYG